MYFNLRYLLSTWCGKKYERDTEEDKDHSIFKISFQASSTENIFPIFDASESL